MRRLLFPILTAIVLAGGFLAYSLMQTPPATDPDAAAAPEQSKLRPLPAVATQPAPTRENANSLIGPGEKIWVKQYDKKTSQLSTEFRAERYDPVDDQTLRVVKPEARFYLAKGQVLYIRGDDGVVAMQSPGGNAGDLRSSPGAQPPNSGDLRNVVIELLPTTADDARPILTVTLPNASFDNDTFRIFTQAYSGADGGKTVEADQVPVQVRGDDYDFDGRGLTIRWNERDRKLQLLEVAHG